MVIAFFILVDMSMALIQKGFDQSLLFIEAKVLRH